MQNSKKQWSEWLSIAGSVASVTGLSLLTLNKAFDEINTSTIISYIIVSVFLVGLLAVAFKIVYLVTHPLFSKVHYYWKISLALILMPIFVLLLLIPLSLLPSVAKELAKLIAYIHL